MGVLKGIGLFIVFLCIVNNVKNVVLIIGRMIITIMFYGLCVIMNVIIMLNVD